MACWSIHGNKEITSLYEILGRIGSGTYADVYKARRRADDLVVALKEIHDHRSSYREIQALLQLGHHPHIIKLFEYFWYGEQAVLVLEYLPSSLDAVIKEGQQRDCNRLTEPEVKGWMLQLLRGVAVCHAAFVLHRDFKPSNLLISSEGVLKIADFGQARILHGKVADSVPQRSLVKRDLPVAMNRIDLSDEESDGFSARSFAMKDFTLNDEVLEFNDDRGFEDQTLKPVITDFCEVKYSGCAKQTGKDKANISPIISGELHGTELDDVGDVTEMADSNLIHISTVEISMPSVEIGRDRAAVDSRISRLVEFHRTRLDAGADMDASPDQNCFLIHSAEMEEREAYLDGRTIEEKLLGSADEKDAHELRKWTIGSKFTERGQIDGFLKRQTLEYEISSNAVFKETIDELENIATCSGHGLVEDEPTTGHSGKEGNEEEISVFGDYSEISEGNEDFKQRSLSWVEVGTEKSWEARLDRKTIVCDSSEQRLSHTLSERSRGLFGMENDANRKGKDSGYTGCIGTRWYRAPELLYGATTYSTEVDMWAVGCIFGELLMCQPLFPCNSDIEQLSKVVSVLGNPTEEIWPGVSLLPDYGKVTFMNNCQSLSLQQHIPEGSEEAHKLLGRLINYDISSRLSAVAALQHEYFSVEPFPAAFDELKVPFPDVEDDNLSEAWKDLQNSWSSSHQEDLFFFS